MVRFLLLFMLVYSFQAGYSQSKKVYKPSMQTCNCNFKIDSSYRASVPTQLKADSTFTYKIDSSFHTICGLQDASAIKNVPFMITEMIKGNHAPYIQKKLDDIFNRNIAPNGMRMSVYCADQASYHSEEVIQQLWRLYPFLRGYHINDVYKAFCDCWKVPPVSVQTKQPYYSNKPVLIGDGEMDPACSPLYMYMIKHYMPNAQCFLFINKSHGVGGTTFRQMTQAFLDHPYNRIESPNEKIIAY